MANELLIELPLELKEITYGEPQDAEIVTPDAIAEGGLALVEADLVGEVSSDVDRDDVLASVDMVLMFAEVDLEIEGDV